MLNGIKGQKKEKGIILSAFEWSSFSRVMFVNMIRDADTFYDSQHTCYKTNVGHVVFWIDSDQSLEPPTQ